MAECELLADNTNATCSSLHSHVFLSPRRHSKNEIDIPGHQLSPLKKWTHELNSYVASSVMRGGALVCACVCRGVFRVGGCSAMRNTAWQLNRQRDARGIGRISLRASKKQLEQNLRTWNPHNKTKTSNALRLLEIKKALGGYLIFEQHDKNYSSEFQCENKR